MNVDLADLDKTGGPKYSWSQRVTLYQIAYGNRPVDGLSKVEQAYVLAIRKNLEDLPCNTQSNQKQH